MQKVVLREFCEEKGEKLMKKNCIKKRVLPWALLAAFSALVFYYDDTERIFED